MHPLLFSVDLEEFYPAAGGEAPGCTPLATLVDRYLALLAAHAARSTFFVVGEVARKFPSVIARLAAAGHEIACHGDRHRTLDDFDASSFVADLRANRAAVEAAGAPPPRGFRAPLFSLTARTAWAYRILRDEGFTYSSSVLPAPSPLFGWPEFGESPRAVEGVIEIPISLARCAGRALPLFGGTYFRVAPFSFVRPRLRRALQAAPVRAYFHPYDIDAAQPWCLHAGVNGRRALNVLLFLRRRSLPSRIAAMLQLAAPTSTYAQFAATVR